MSTRAVLAGCVNEIGIPLERLTGIRAGAWSDPASSRSTWPETRWPTAWRGRATRPTRSIWSSAATSPAATDPGTSCSNPAPRRGYGAMRPCHAVALTLQRMRRHVHRRCRGRRIPAGRTDRLRHGRQWRIHQPHQRDGAKVIEGPMDPRLACLTVGDAGAAVIFERGPNDRVGFHDIDMATLSRYGTLCVAKANDGPVRRRNHDRRLHPANRHGGQRSLPYIAAVMNRHGWRPERATTSSCTRHQKRRSTTRLSR